MTHSLIRRLLSDDRGVTAPEAIAATLVNAIIMGALVTSLIGIITLNSTAQGSTAAVATAQTTELQWRDHLRHTRAITAIDDTTVILTRIHPDGRCVEAIWATDPVDGSLNIHTTTHPDSVGSTCTGTPTVETRERIDSADTVFTYTNPVGRALEFHGGAPHLGGGTRPAHVTETEWDDAIIGSVTLTLTVMPGTPWTLPAQFIHHLPNPPAPVADDSSHPVNGGGAE